MYVICFTFGNILLFSLVQAVLTLAKNTLKHSHMTCFHHYFPLSTWYLFYLYKDPLSLLGWSHPSLLVHFSQNTTSRIINLQLHAIFSVKKSIVLKIILIFHSLQLKSYLLYFISLQLQRICLFLSDFHSVGILGSISGDTIVFQYQKQITPVSFPQPPAWGHFGPSFSAFLLQWIVTCKPNTTQVQNQT